MAIKTTARRHAMAFNRAVSRTPRKNKAKLFKRGGIRL